MQNVLKNAERQKSYHKSSWAELSVWQRTRYLFGSFANGTYTKDSDFDFYIVVKDGTNLWDVTAKARKAVRDIKTRPVDVIAGTSSRFKEYGQSGNTLFVEGEVFRKGLLLYENESAGEYV